MRTIHPKRAAQRLLTLLFPFGWGNITKLQLVYFFSTLYIYIPVGTLYLRSKELSYLQINSLWGLIVFTKFLSEIPTGLLADRLGRSRAVQAALGLQLLGEVIYLFARGYPGFVLSAVVAGVGFAFSSGCVEALVFESLQTAGREGEMSKALGAVEAIQRLANLLAFATTGLVVQKLTETSFTWAVAITAAMVGVGFLLTFTLEDTESDSVKETANSWQLLREAGALLQDNRAFRSLTLVFLMTLPFRDYLGSLYQPHFVAAGVGAAWFGLSLALAAGLRMVGARSAYLLEEKLGQRNGLLLAVALPGLLYLLFAQLSHPLWTVVTFLALSGSMSLRMPLISAQLNAYIERRNRATVLSLIGMLVGLYEAGMGLLIGALADIAVPRAFYLMGGLVLLGALLLRAMPPTVASTAERRT
jgi:MFS family permease